MEPEGPWTEALKNNVLIKFISLMVKPLFTLATRLLSTHGSFVCTVSRIRSGFLPRENLDQAKQQLAEIQRTLREIEETLKQDQSRLVTLSSKP